MKVRLRTHLKAAKIKLKTIMKKINKFLCASVLGLSIAAFALPTAAADKTADKAYPLDTCVVSGEKLGEMGHAYVFNYKGQEIKLCCKKCKKKFDKDPEAYLKKIAAAQAKK